MLVSDCLKHSFRMIRELEKLRKIKQYRQVTQNSEIAALTEEKMESNDWERITEAEGWKKAYKYHKEKYVKNELATERKQVSDREKEIDDISIEINALNDWKNFFMVTFEQEGNIDFDESQYMEMSEEIIEEYQIIGS